MPGISVLDIIKDQIEDIRRIERLWEAWARGELSSEKFWDILVEPQYSALIRAKYLPEEKQLFYQIANQIKDFRETFSKYIKNKVTTTELFEKLRNLTNQVGVLLEKYSEYSRPLRK